MSYETNRIENISSTKIDKAAPLEARSPNPMISVAFLLITYVTAARSPNQNTDIAAMIITKVIAGVASND